MTDKSRTAKLVWLIFGKLPENNRARKLADIPKKWEEFIKSTRSQNNHLCESLLHWGIGPLHLPLAWHTMVCFCVGSIQLVSGHRISNFSPSSKGLRFFHEMESFVTDPKAGRPGKGHRAAQPNMAKVDKITNLNRNMFLSQSHDFEWRDLIWENRKLNEATFRVEV